MIFLDAETCGLHGVPVLLQYAIAEEPVQLWNFWTNPILESLNLIEMIANHPDGICGFNLAFDWFHMCKIYTILRLHENPTICPQDDIPGIAALERKGMDGPCLKPVKACDLMLHARKGPYQSTMDRHDIRIKRVPTPLAWQLAGELEQRIPLKDIYFARRADKTAEKWKVYDRHDDTGELDTDFKDVVLKFAPSSALKALAIDALGIEEDAILLFTDVEVDRAFWPNEEGYAPYAHGPGSWPDFVHAHIDHWEWNELARTYAEKDVVYTRDLWKFFDRPEGGDDDSELACMVAAVRWKGFKIDLEKIKALRENAIERSKKAPQAPGKVKEYIWPYLSVTERVGTGGSTKKVILEDIAEFVVDCSCVEEVMKLDSNDLVDYACPLCKGTGEVPHPAAIKAQEVLDARKAQKEVELFDKLIEAGRFHASFKVIGTLSSRMAGADGLNPQAIKATEEVRSCFPLAFDDTILCGGDFKSFEVVIAEATYNDPKLREDVLSGKKIHALFGEAFYSDETYDSIVASADTENDLYKKAKSGLFSQMYGGNEHTLMDRLGVSLDDAKRGQEHFEKRYPGVARKRKRIEDMFCSMRQPGGIGKKVVWHDPADYIASLLGFRRYFTLENNICRALFNLAENPPKSWNHLKIKVMRRDREQTASGAVRSALFGAAFAIQSANMRAAANHEIQSTGAQITKYVQRKIWDLQPPGANEWYVQPMNVHDEILTPTRPDYVIKVEQVVKDGVEHFKSIVPLIAIDWFSKMKSWAEKKG